MPIGSKIKYGEIADDDPIKLVAADIAAEAWLLVLRRVPRHRHRRRHDPRPPVHAPVRARRRGGGDVECGADDLYKDGLNRALFLPFIELLERRTWRSCGSPSRTDFRLEKLAGLPVWYAPVDDDAEVALDMAWERLTGTLEGAAATLAVKGRIDPRAARRRWGWRASPSPNLCEQPLGAGDYLRIAHEFHTIVLDHVPVMGFGASRRRQALHHPDRHALRQRA